jgi:hypothetical membrane protein
MSGDETAATDADGGDSPPNTTTDDWSAQRLARFAAPAMAVLWIGGTLLATALFPGFDWTQDAINKVGTAGEPTAPILDGSLFVGSLLGLAFLWRVAREKRTTVQRAGIVLMGLMVFISGFGQLGIPQPYLLILVLSLIWLLPVAFGVYGTAEVLEGDDRIGVLSFWFGIVHLLSWQIISNAMGFSSAIPAFITIALLAAWVLALYWELPD